MEYIKIKTKSHIQNLMLRLICSLYVYIWLHLGSLYMWIYYSILLYKQPQRKNSNQDYLPLKIFRLLKVYVDLYFLRMLCIKAQVAQHINHLPSHIRYSCVYKLENFIFIHAVNVVGVLVFFFFFLVIAALTTEIPLKSPQAFSSFSIFFFTSSIFLFRISFSHKA